MAECLRAIRALPDMERRRKRTKKAVRLVGRRGGQQHTLAAQVGKAILVDEFIDQWACSGVRLCPAVQRGDFTPPNSNLDALNMESSGVGSGAAAQLAGSSAMSGSMLERYRKEPSRHATMTQPTTLSLLNSGYVSRNATTP